MPEFLLHALWVRGSGLQLWVEQFEGHRIMLPSAAGEGAFPAVVAELLDDAHFRRRGHMTLQTPKGRRIRLPVPTMAFEPARAVELLAALSRVAEDVERGVASSRLQTQWEAIAPDLKWLVHMYRGVVRFVRAGRVTIGMSYFDGEWYPQWLLAKGLPERGWMAQMIAAAPGVLAINEPELNEEMTGTFVHWVVWRELAKLREEERSVPWHDFADSLMRSLPVRRGGPGLVRSLTDWRQSITAVDVQLVFIVEAPPNDDQLAAAGYDDEKIAELESSQVAWPVRVQVRSGTNAPVPVRVESLDAGTVEILRRILQRAVGITSLVDHREHGQVPTEGIYRGISLGNEGDWDVYLSTDQIVLFVSQDAAALQRQGFSVMLPKTWSTAHTSAKLETSQGADDRVRGATIGMEQLVNYNWRVSVGETELTDAEMQDLVRSKSGLIRLRGQWVLADKNTLATVTEYMEQLSERSHEKEREEIERLAMEAELARATNEPGWEHKIARVEQLREEFNAAGPVSGRVSMAELRQLALEAVAEEPIEFTGSTWHAKLLSGELAQSAPERVEIPASVHAQLRDYQRRGVDWLVWMSRNNLGAVLADDMGLGKTLQLLTLLAIEKESGETSGPTLVVAPTSVVGNWLNEAHRFVPSLKAMVHHGTERLHGEELKEALDSLDVLITSYGVVSRDHKELAEFAWDRVVLDEAQAIKNPTTRAAKAVRSLPSRHRIALTGTPVENRLYEMRAILDFVNPGILGSASFFRNTFSRPIERDNNELMAERLRTLTAPFILRRLKSDPDIIEDLPDKKEEILTVSMTAEQAALYTALTESVQRQLEEKQGIERRGLILAMITRIKQICNHPAHFLGDGSGVTSRGRHRSGKVEKLMEILDRAAAKGERVLIFTQYRAFGDILQPYLSERMGEKIPFLHGGITKTQRDRMVEEFQQPKGSPAMILSLKAGGTGLNLTAASVVVHMDRWWNPAVENQATDRAYRIGQDRNVRVFKMITAGTLEESIQDILDGKTELSGAVITEGEGWITELEPEQLSELMSYRGRKD